MSGNSFGDLFSFTTFGESHGTALGVIIDGMPAGVPVDEDFLRSEMDRRRPGTSKLTTQRSEKDQVKILSGTFEGVTTGTPIACVVFNEDQHSKDYSNIAHVFRPGHADYTYTKKYGVRDYRGGGRSSGRETLARVIAGAFAKMALRNEGITVDAGVVGVGGVEAEDYWWKPPFQAPLFAPENKNLEKMIAAVDEARATQDSIGSLVECRIKGVPAGLGEPCFDKLDALLAHAIFSLGAVKGFEIGSGFSASTKKGSENNDNMYMENGEEKFETNNAGGILGGISNGNDIVFRAAFKPTPSISKEQETITDQGEDTKIQIVGRHDPCIGPRAVVVVEAMASAVILDELLKWKAYSND